MHILFPPINSATSNLPRDHLFYLLDGVQSSDGVWVARRGEMIQQFVQYNKHAFTETCSHAKSCMFSPLQRGRSRLSTIPFGVCWLDPLKVTTKGSSDKFLFVPLSEQESEKTEGWSCFMRLGLYAVCTFEITHFYTDTHIHSHVDGQNQTGILWEYIFNPHHLTIFCRVKGLDGESSK